MTSKQFRQKPYLPPSRRLPLRPLAGTEASDASELPDIPVLKRKQEEGRRKGAVPPVTLSGGGAASGTWAGGQAVVRGEGFFPALASLLTSKTSLALLTVAVSAPAMYAFHTIWKALSARAAAVDSMLEMRTSVMSLGAKTPPSPSGSSLDLFAKANAGSEVEKGMREEFRDSSAAVKTAAPAPIQAAAGPAAGPPPKPASAPAPAVPEPRAAAAPPAAHPAPKLASMIGLAGPSGISGGIMQPFLGRYEGNGRGAVTPLRGNHAQRGTGKGLANMRRDARKIVVPRNALGQLRFANRKSRLALTTKAPEATSRVANDAFELGKTQPGGGLILKGPGQGRQPDVNSHTYAQNFPPVPQVIGTSNVTPYQGQLDSAHSMLDSAVVAKATGIMLLILGIIMVWIGRLLPEPFGWPLIVTGLALIALGWSLILLARRLRRASFDIGTSIADQYGQKDQGTIVHQCTKQARHLIPVEACNPADKPAVQRGEVEQDDDVFLRIGKIPGGNDAFMNATNVTPPSDSSSADPSGSEGSGAGAGPSPDQGSDGSR